MKVANQWKILVIMCGFNVVLFIQWLNMETHLSNAMIKYPLAVDTDLRSIRYEDIQAIGPYVVNSKVCKIPNLDPMDPSVFKYFKPWKIHCDLSPDITYKDGRFIRINWTTVNRYYSEFTHCEYTPFYRSRYSDKRIRFESLKTQKFTNDIEVKEQFIHVSCYSKKILIYTNYHIFIFKEHFGRMRNLTRLAMQNIDKSPGHLNVLMIGIDSVSRMNFIRHMHKTRSFLIEHFDAVEMRGYNTIDDSTFVNLMGMLTGRTGDGIDRKGYPSDKLPLIWENFANSSYVTMYAEEHTAIGPFNYYRKGFSTQPTDFYLRPYMMAVESNKRETNNNHCFRNKLFIEIVFDCVEDFLTVFRYQSHFGFIYLGKLTHFDSNGLSVHDDIHFRFLNKMADEKLLDNTVLIYFSGKGTRYGDTTLVGRFEERLPILMVSVPRWIKDGRLDIVNNLKSNADKLTSSFDIYATLTEILQINKYPTSRIVSKTSSGISLFQRVPIHRSCRIAKIPGSHCACASTNQISVNDHTVKNAAWCFLFEINKKLRGYGKICENLKLKSVKNAEITEYSEEIKQDEQKIVEYELIIVSSPGNAIFKGTVRTESAKKCRMVSEIHRIDEYEKPNCMFKEPSLTEFCICKKSNRVDSEKWKYMNETFW